MSLVYLPRGNQTIGPHLSRQYGIAVRAVHPLDVGVLRIDRDDGPAWVARVFQQERPLERTSSDARLLAVLASAGLPAERPACSEPVSVLDGHGVLVTEFVAGTAPARSRATARRLADVIGRLQALPWPDGIEAGGALHHIPAYEGLPGREIALAAALLDDIDERITGARRRGFEALRLQVASADDCADLPRALVHPDPVPRNVVASGRTLTLVDWTGAGIGPRIAGLAPVVMQAMRPAGWDLATLDAVAQAYRTHVRLEAREVERLPSALRIRQLWLAAWNYWTRTVTGRPPSGTEWWMPLTDPAYEPLRQAAAAAFLE